MKTSFRHLFLSAVVALVFTCAFAVFAQETPVPKSPPPAAAAPAAEATAQPAAVPAEPVETVAPSAPVAGAESADSDKGGLRRLDEPAKAKAKSGGKRRSETGGSGSQRKDVPFGDQVVPKGTEQREVVSIFGSTTVEGTVQSDAVSVGGDTRVGPEGKVGGAAAAVLGKLYVDGDVRRDAVSVLGGVKLNGTVGGELVSVLGDVYLGPNAVVTKDLVIIGGKLTKDPGAVVKGSQVKIAGMDAIGGVEWLTTWFQQCLLKGRPLGFGPHLGVAWLIAGAFLAFYLLLALAFPNAIEKCAVTFETRPGGSILAAFLAVLLSPIATILLALTIVGAVLVPFLGMGLFVAGLVGKTVMFAWMGRRLSAVFNPGVRIHPFFAVLIGGVLVMFLYTIWGSFLLFKLLSWLGLGVVVYTIALNLKREKAAVPAGGAPRPSQAPVAAVVAPVMPMSSVAPAATVSPGFTGAGADQGPAATGLVSGYVPEPLPPVMGATAPSAAPVNPFLPPAPPEISASTLPRAGFFLRLAALAIDGVLIGMIVGFTSSLLPRFLQFNHGPGGLLLALAIYGAIMWKQKGTTIGGIVCGLKVVRIDHRELDWATAIVRALGCFLSLAVAGLGFIWVAFDDDKQSWHDKIAGTTVVIVPKGQSLL